MTAHPTIIQAAFAIPVMIGLVVYSLMRWDRTPLNLLLVLLLSSLWPWLAAQVIKLVASDLGVRSLALDVEVVAVAFMPPLLVIALGHFARIKAFESSRALSAALMVLPLLFLAMYFTNAQHGLVVTDRAAAIAGEAPQRWAGSVYWSFQLWCAICDGVAFAILIWAMRRARCREESKRATMILGAILAPVIAHFVYVLELQPVDFSLVPAALGATAVLFVHGIHRYGLLEAQPVVRSDVIDHLQDGLILGDEHGVIIDANAVGETILGAPRAALVGLHFDEALALLSPKAELGGFCEKIAQLPLDGGHLSGHVHTRDGRAIEVTAGAVAANASQPGGRFLSLRDRSEVFRTERLLRERQRLESAGILAAGVAHEVNNPLAFVRANLAHLQALAEEERKRWGSRAEGPEWEELDEVLAESIEGLDRISRVMDSMLRFSRLPQEGMRLVDPNEVMRTALRLAQLHRNRVVQVEEALADSVPKVMGSSERLVQVVLNLFLNGKQALAGHPDARIFAETSYDEQCAILRVRDNGPGIPEELRDRIFDPFFTTRAPDEGTGLGLAIAFDIVREHGGTLELDTQAERGTCFTIRLPMAADSDAGEGSSA